MRSSSVAILVTLLFSGVGVLGDYFLKLASEHPVPWLTRSFLIGFVIYSSTAFGWVYVMGALKLATIGVFYSVAMIVLLTIVGFVAFGEKLALQEIVGILMGLGALILLARFA
jgi:drug/metabolite transporter (DMT)-like permease